MTVYLWPKRGMTWEMFAFALGAMVEFARTQGLQGYRFDVCFDSTVVGLGAVTASEKALASMANS